ncbi:MAG: ParM/StbA family protein [Anaerolineae bacterium]|nr:ParM/StbA family protein [Anaerolineae bacterium]
MNNVLSAAKLRRLPVIGLDIGYGNVKAFNGSETIKFPAIWGRATDARYESAATRTNYQNDDIFDEDGHWLVGEKARKHIPAAMQRNLRGRMMDEQAYSHQARLRLAKAVFAKFFPDAADGDVIQILLATGLPVSHMTGVQAFRDLLLQPIPIRVDDGREFVVHPARVFVMPQPYGTFYKASLNPDGSINPHFTARRTGIFDPGTFSTDAALDDEGEFINAQSDTLEIGVSTIQNAIADEYERRHGQKPGYRDIEQGVKTGYITVRGTPEDFREVRAVAGNNLAEGAIQLAGRLWGTGADIDLVLVTGGGARFVIDRLKAQFPQAELMEDSETANAEGYRRLALNVVLHADEPA